VLNELEERFTNDSSRDVIIGLLHLLPRECLKVSDDVMVPDDLLDAVEFFKSDLLYAVMLQIEYDSWVWQWM